ncbi:PEP-CTERM sorting domain-containing protein [Futiania mangrovi]|uniref:PEP-CTERM sorting domain-containing protein n=1 Tax=Futiania mangrovi TaxID=2959716 RepID=A0A9J6PDU6_9PROT|nr:PEP-CTERM sorting domain-containing protein [Futiania mangrovii]MCP1335992.1 PEP-CTERM sorting domain-containing protein [Futiania mangrovii]
MKKLITSTAFAAAMVVGVAGTASAGIIVHDTEAEFTITNNQAGGVAANRSILGNMFDNDTTTMFSLGLGGNIALEIVPSTNAITDGTVVELTNLGSNHAESAILSLFDVGTATWIDIAELFNNAAPGGTQAVDAGSGVATVVGVVAGATSNFTLTVLSGTFNAMRLTDTSSNIVGTGSTDGFDIAELSVTSVPEPGMLGLMGVGLLGLGFAAARRRA